MSKESVLKFLEVAETLEDLEKAVHVTLSKLVPADRYWIWQESKRRHKEEILKVLELAAKDDIQVDPKNWTVCQDSVN